MQQNRRIKNNPKTSQLLKKKKMMNKKITIVQKMKKKMMTINKIKFKKEKFDLILLFKISNNGKKNKDYPRIQKSLLYQEVMEI